MSKISNSTDSSSSDNGGLVIVVSIFLIGVISYVIYENFWVIREIWRWIRIVTLFPYSLIPTGIFDFVDQYYFKEVVRFLWDNDGKTIMNGTIKELDDALYLFSMMPIMMFIFLLSVKRIVAPSVSKRNFTLPMLLKEQENTFDWLKGVTDSDPLNTPLIYKNEDELSHKTAKPLTPFDWGRLSPPLELVKNKKIEKKAIFTKLKDGTYDFDQDLAERALIVQLRDKYTTIEALRDTEKELFHVLKKNILMPINNRTYLIEKTLSEFPYFKDKQLAEKNLANVRSASKKVLIKLLSDICKDTYNNADKNEWLLIKQIDSKLEKLQAENSIDSARKSLHEKRKNLLVEIRNKRHAHFENFNSFNSVKELANNKKITALIKECVAESIMEKHNFSLCGIMSLFIAAKKTGVLTTMEVSDKYRETDRLLWIAMANMGRGNVSFAECMGLMSHLVFEQEQGYAVEAPAIESAIDGLLIEVAREHEHNMPINEMYTSD